MLAVKMNLNVYFMASYRVTSSGGFFFFFCRAAPTVCIRLRKCLISVGRCQNGSVRVIKVPVQTSAELSSSVTDLQCLLFARPPHVYDCAQYHITDFFFLFILPFRQIQLNISWNRKLHTAVLKLLIKCSSCVLMSFFSPFYLYIYQGNRSFHI